MSVAAELRLPQPNQREREGERKREKDMVKTSYSSAGLAKKRKD